MTTLANCTLTEELLERFARSTRRMIEVLADPQVRLAVQRQEEQAPLADRVRNVAAIARRFERIPAMRAAIEAEGMSTREYVIVQLTLFQSVMAAAFLDAEGPARLTELPKGTSQENVDFVRAQRERIDRLTAEVKALTVSANSAAMGEGAAARPGAQRPSRATPPRPTSGETA